MHIEMVLSSVCLCLLFLEFLIFCFLFSFFLTFGLPPWSSPGCVCVSCVFFRCFSSSLVVVVVVVALSNMASASPAGTTLLTDLLEHLPVLSPWFQIRFL